MVGISCRSSRVGAKSPKSSMTELVSATTKSTPSPLQSISMRPSSSLRSRPAIG
uniref:Quinate O-hydroxycinnamoyltransferase n=1 Tax=Rhizophora mucronata TaxID=61149 RepID=A0A2P2J9D8_RHIMU